MHVNSNMARKPRIEERKLTVQTDSQIRSNPELTGRAAYAASLKAAPNYHDGTPRKTWEQLGDIERWSWSKPVRKD